MSTYGFGTVEEGTSSELPSQPRLNCDDVYLTSPLGGLPDGEVTFYWDPAPNAIGYTLILYSGDQKLLSTYVAAPATNRTTNVSHAAIGGDLFSPIRVRLMVSDGQGTTCTKDYEMMREAPAKQAPVTPTPMPPPPNPVPEPTPDCELDPNPEYC